MKKEYCSPIDGDDVYLGYDGDSDIPALVRPLKTKSSMSSNITPLGEINDGYTYSKSTSSNRPAMSKRSNSFI